MKRRCDCRRKNHEKWYCQNKDCKKVITIKDDAFIKRLIDILNELIKKCEDIEYSPREDFSGGELPAIKNEIENLFINPSKNEEKIQEKINEYFSEIYNKADKNMGKTMRIARSEPENISANVKWGKLQSAKKGKVAFMYKNFLGYRKGADGNPEIDEEQAETVKIIYDRFLAGDSLKQIAEKLQNEKRLSPSGKSEWSTATIRSILSNEKYKGDAIINKTFTVDCLTKEIRKNNGERPKYYIENNHPAIIDAETFGRVQEELARRIGKKKVKEIGTKTEQGKYSS